MDKITALRSFAEVASTGSYTQAAEQLGISRVKVTRHIKELEDWLNVRLLHRTTRKVSLTAPGEELISQSERVLHEVAHLERIAHSHNEELIGEIRIASPIGLGQNLLYEALVPFTLQHPKVRVQLVMSDSNAQLVEEHIDVALRYTNQPDDSLIARKLMSIDSALCCSPEYIQKHGQIDALGQLKHHNCLVHVPQRSWTFIEQEQLRTIEVNGNIKANDVSVLINACIDGLGVAYLPCDLANPHIQSGKLVRLLRGTILPTMSLWAVYLSRSYQRPAVRAFIDHLAAQWQTDIKAP
ncbi:MULTISPECIES: LysR family transcriptional regulator [Pseudoalteromonas]|uniref:LysR family transcriptional regulator n=1 Tax=Pseudoalteromonas amylolytica TaxID=1859457 RepID=A0A1S1MXM3_9GAMM|nr:MULTISPECIES: LysR family transcriptional regulator [Pseudoalteromonas]OHU89022.1 LysR family transcriptional regulator [Pseudoalteromonas sp. JW3]OHU91922.1 LysR family transcriptional regulator [Pseudoalteromonas amylolytica]